MPELPWEKWFPTNWASEPGLRLCRPSTRGIWFDVLNTMMLSQGYRISGTNEELCSLLSCLPVELTMAIEQLKSRNVADIYEQDGNIVFESRKRKRDCEIKALRSKAGLASATKRQHTPQHGDQKIGQQDASTRSSSASAYASDGRGTGGTLAESPPWEEFWEYCQSVHCGIGAEWYAKEKYWAACQDNWKGKSNWRSYAQRVRVWWENDGRPMKPPAKPGQPQKTVHHLRDSIPPEP